MRIFRNKVAAITGAGSGIGRALALQLAREGCHLALSDVQEIDLHSTAKLVSTYGVQVTTTVMDVSDRFAMIRWADAVVRDHKQVNLVFNNAGVAMGGFAETVSRSDFEWIMNINFWGVVWGTQAFLPHLKRSGEGHVVNTSSMSGIFATPTQSAYCASKFAVRGFTEALRQELDMEKCGVSVTCVHPGAIRTSIARSAKMDASMQIRTGGQSEQARARFDRMLNLTTAEKAAEQILAGVRRNQRQVLVGIDAHVLDKLTRLLGPHYQPITAWIAQRFMLKND